MWDKQAGQSKKTYETPLVTVHGTVEKITEGGAKTAMDTPGGNPGS